MAKKLTYDHLPTISTRRITLTPTLAQELLDGAAGEQRKPSRFMVDYLVRQIEKGEWRLTHQGIALNKDGRMVDGQHRCLAVIQSDTPVPILLSSGLDSEDFQVLDSGKRRIASDVLSIRGELYAPTLSSLARLVDSYRVAQRDPDQKLMVLLHTQISPAEVISILEEFPELRHSAVAGHSMTRFCRFSPSVLSFAHFIMSAENPPMADQLTVDVMSGENLQRGDLALAIRNFNSGRENRDRSININMLANGARRALDGKPVHVLKKTAKLPDFKVFE